MPSANTKIPSYKPAKRLEIDLDSFKGGWVNIYKPTELKNDELVQADNLMLTGRGVPTGRWGSQTYFKAGDTNVNLLEDYINPKTSTNILYAITDDGYMVKKLNASYDIISGASFASGYSCESAQLGGYSYIVSEGSNMVRFDGTQLDVYKEIESPTDVLLSNISGATGTYNWSWRVTAVSEIGETLGSTGVALAGLPLDLTETQINVTWTAPSAASGDIDKYSIYRGFAGKETYVGQTSGTETEWVDYGNPQSDVAFPPTANTTGGVKGKYILKFDDRLIIAGIEDDPTLVMISGRYPNQDKFNWTYGGGYVLINPDGGGKITGLAISGSQTQGGTTPASILVFFDDRAYQLILKTTTIGNYLLLDPQYQLLAPTGCSNNKNIEPIENNTLYFGRQGLFTIGSEAAYLNQIRTKELSARIRDYVSGLSDDDFVKSTAGYMDYKYLLSFPDRSETIIYDYERAAFMGPWKTPFGITEWKRYRDETGSEQWLAGCNDGIVRKFHPAYKSDSGTAIKKLLRTKKIDFGDWSVMKIIENLYVMFRDVSGTVSINILLEERNGSTVNKKSFNIKGALGTAGWGTDLWGSITWGESGETVAISGEEIIKWAQLFKTARILQLEVLSNGATDDWVFLGTKAFAKKLGQGSLSAETRV